MADGMTADRRAAGHELLAQLDDAGLEPCGAGWVHDQQADRWFYMLVTPLVDEWGPHWIYERLVSLFRHHPLPRGIAPPDLRIFSPRERGVRQIATLCLVSDGEAELQNCRVDDLVLDHALLYRMAPPDTNVRANAAHFAARVQQLTAV